MSDSFGFIYFIYFIKHEKENLEDLRALPMHETINNFYNIEHRTKKTIHLNARFFIVHDISSDRNHIRSPNGLRAVSRPLITVKT